MPVRYYSAGMLVRLAFSIATAIEPEILLVDEVLSVGDLAFQQKARQRMHGDDGEGPADGHGQPRPGVAGPAVYESHLAGSRPDSRMSARRRT